MTVPGGYPGLVKTFTAAVVLALAVVACGGDDRPDAATWLTEWDALTSVVPDQSEVGDPPDSELCQKTLASLREQTDGVMPTPSATVDDLAAEWSSVAESAFFDCPPEGEEISSFDDAYSEMRRIEESVVAALTED